MNRTHRIHQTLSLVRSSEKAETKALNCSVEVFEGKA